MPKIVLLLVLFCCSVLFASGQQIIAVKGDSLIRGDSTKLSAKKTDTVKYINYGKIAARKALFRSMIIPGWGQLTTGPSVYRLLKVAAIYVGETALILSYKTNSKNYHHYLSEIQWRDGHDGTPKPGNGLGSQYSTDNLITAKEVYRRNREVVIISIFGVYAVNVIDAYVDARLKYFDVGDNLAIKISPSVISQSSMMYGYNPSYAPALKFSLRF
ncbi:DUF5683 domain-containing protein [Pedobacter sp. L105]|uniref:DUF5683 domain-containing protein n=1 Tax=Pedobacter sp. L105 TaxID=1641871 RepID=UPI00131D0F38|nr:DUF5683 domain-containing protein [Pedobacter sp. L105]